MSEYKSQCGCKIHVAQWTSKRKLVSVKQCPLHKAAPALLEACKAALAMMDSMDEIDPRCTHGYGLVEEKLFQAIAAAEREEDTHGCAI